jgi:hypothetical protein
VSCPGREAPVVEGHRDDYFARARYERERARFRPEKSALEQRFVDLDLVARPLKLGELSDQLDEGRDICNRCWTNHRAKVSDGLCRVRERENRGGPSDGPRKDSELMRTTFPNPVPEPPVRFDDSRPE